MRLRLKKVMGNFKNKEKLDDIIEDSDLNTRSKVINEIKFFMRTIAAMYLFSNEDVLVEDLMKLAREHLDNLHYADKLEINDLLEVYILTVPRERSSNFIIINKKRGTFESPGRIYLGVVCVGNGDFLCKKRVVNKTINSIAKYSQYHKERGISITLNVNELPKMIKPLSEIVESYNIMPSLKTTYKKRISEALTDLEIKRNKRFRIYYYDFPPVDKIENKAQYEILSVVLTEVSKELANVFRIKLNKKELYEILDNYRNFVFTSKEDLPKSYKKSYDSTNITLSI